MKAWEKTWPKDSIVRDHARRRAMLKFLKSAIPEKASDGRVGLVLAMAWDVGYQNGLKRGRRQRRAVTE